MRNTTDWMRQVYTLALAAAILSPLPLVAETRVRLVNWENLPVVTGHTVRISLAGANITGKAGTVEADALVVDVQKTSDPTAWPKGRLRVPREKLHRLEMETKGKFFRAAGTILAGTVAIGVGYAIGTYGVDRCNFWSGSCPQGRSAGGVATAVGISAAGIAGGYFAGNALDTRWTVIEIVP
jgi:hypothetical protein